MHKSILMQGLQRLQYTSRYVFKFFPIQSSFHRGALKIALQVLQRDGHRHRRLVDFIDQRSEVRGTMLKSFEYISLIFHPRVTFDTLDHDKLL